jgi:hypothetical protein
MSSEFCKACGAEYAHAPTPFCRHCGIPRWLAILAFVSAGGWLLAVAVDSLDAVLRPELAAFTAGDRWVRLEIYGAITLDAMLGGLLIVNAWMLYRGHRTARGLG